MLRQYIAAQWSPYLSTPRTGSSESFYQTLIGYAERYLKRGDAALDIGCATGRLVFEYERLGAGVVVGVDESAPMIAYCHRIKAGTAPEIAASLPAEISAFRVGDIMQLGFDRTFDFISCINVLDRVRHPRALIERIGQLLAPHSVALVVDPYDWDRSDAAESERVHDAKQLIDADAWDILEENSIPYTVADNGADRTFACHVLVLRRRGQSPAGSGRRRNRAILKR